jgi:hypothetical protein
MKNENKKPWKVMFEGRPYSSELDYQMEIDYCTKEGIDWWDNKSPKEVIQEVEEILDRYTIGSGWVHAEEIEDGSKGAIKERNDLRKVVAHLKRQYKKHYAN